MRIDCLAIHLFHDSGAQAGPPPHLVDNTTQMNCFPVNWIEYLRQIGGPVKQINHALHLTSI